MPPASGRDIDRLVDDLFRHEAGRLIAILTRIFGPANLGLAEDVAQEALIAALEVWPYHGVPDNPTAWLTQVAKNRALNVLKRERIFAGRAHELAAQLDEAALAAEPAGSRSGMDDVVHLLFVACHPALAPETRIALTLKTVAGLSVEQIAGALLAQPTAISQRLVRAKKQVRELGLGFDVPAAEFPQRLDSVLEALYLLFNEGYGAHDGEDLVRAELCDEAMRLCRLIAHYQDRAPAPRVHALLALMLLQSARLPARVDAAGELVPLEDQDRSRWNQARIAEGLAHLERSAEGDEASSYHLEAGIAAHHAIARSHRDTDWREILALYDQLLIANPSPIVALNRAVALAQCDGPAAGIKALASLQSSPVLQRYHLLWATLATLHAELGDLVAAGGYYRKALACPCSAPERRFLEHRLASLTAPPS